MSITITKIPAITPAFGMPAYASTSHAVQGKCARTWTVEAVATVAVLATDRAKGAFPGDNAWRPPLT